MGWMRSKPALRDPDDPSSRRFAAPQDEDYRVMIHIDRREIAPLLLPHFPEMAGASSDEWHAFLDQVTGLATRLDEQNATAFDRWRQALAAMDIPVWSITPSAAATMKARG